MPIHPSPPREEAQRKPWPLLSAMLLAATLLLGTLAYLTWTPHPIRVGRYALVGPTWGYRPGFDRVSEVVRYQHRMDLAYQGSGPHLPIKELISDPNWDLYDDPHHLIQKLSLR